MPLILVKIRDYAHVTHVLIRYHVFNVVSLRSNNALSGKYCFSRGEGGVISSSVALVGAGKNISNLAIFYASK